MSDEMERPRDGWMAPPPTRPGVDHERFVRRALVVIAVGTSIVGAAVVVNTISSLVFYAKLL